MDQLTKRQRGVLETIARFVDERGYTPTVREIAEAMGLSSPSTVHSHLKSLEKMGYLTCSKGRSRAITLDPSVEQLGIKREGGSVSEHPSPSGEDAFSGRDYSAELTASRDSSGAKAKSGHLASGGFSKVVELPVVGRVAAGSPILAEQNVEDTMELPAALVGDNASFLLQVCGDSMIEAGIFDGDYVAVKIQPDAQDGDVVVAIIDDSATVKTFYREPDRIRLQPENRTLSPIYVRDDVRLAGKVVALLRRM